MTAAVSATQKGISLVAALFVLVIAASLAAFLVSVSAVQHTTAALEAEQARAWYAALAGKEWAAYRVRNDRDCTGVDGVSFTISDGASAANGFTISATCSVTSHHVRGNNDVRYFVIGVTAQRGTYGTEDFVARRLTTKIAEAP